MPFTDNDTETDAYLIKAIAGLFHGFTVSVSESVAELILQYVADDRVDGNAWRTKSLHSHSRPDSSNKIFSSISFYGLMLITGLRLVNSTWDTFVTPLLYRSIHLSSRHQPAALLVTLQQIPDRRFLINMLTISVPPPTETKDYEAYPTHRTLRKLFQNHLLAITHLHFYTISFVSSMIYLKDSLRGRINLKQLSIRCHGPCVAMSTSYIWSIFREFPQLEEFWFEYHGDDGDNTETVREIPKGLYLPKMKRLGISGAVIRDDGVEILCCICPNIEELEIDGENRFCTI